VLLREERLVQTYCLLVVSHPRCRLLSIVHANSHSKFQEKEELKAILSLVVENEKVQPFTNTPSILDNSISNKKVITTE
jgi:hypothetical protein